MRVFVNYQTRDEPFVALLIDRLLSEQLGESAVFRDTRSIEIGREWRTELWGSLARCEVLLAIIGPKWDTPGPDGQRTYDDPDDFVRQEIAFCLGRNITVVPVLVGDKPERPLLQADHLPPDIAGLADRQYDRISSRRGEYDVQRVVDKVLALLRVEARREPVGREGTVALVGIDRFDRTTTEDQRAAAVAEVRTAVERAALDARLGGCVIEDQLGGLRVFVPATTSPVRVITRFADNLRTMLDHGGVHRVRLAVECGPLGGPGPDAADAAVGLLSHPVLDSVLDQATKARVAVVLSPAGYAAMVLDNPRLIDSSTYLPTDNGRCWVRLPGYPAPPGLRKPPAPAEDTRPAASAVTTSRSVVFNNRGSKVGDQYGGDRIEGGVHHHYGSL